MFVEDGDEKEDLNLSEDIVSNDTDTDVDPEVELETEARSKGWKPLDDWEGPKHKWRSAKEFLDVGSFFEKIDNQNKTIRELQESLKALGAHQSKIAKLERDKVLKELNEQKKQAFEEHDFEALDHADKQIRELEAAPLPEYHPAPPAAHNEDPNVEYQKFVDSNSWYKQDPELTAFADTLALGYAARVKAEGKAVVPSELFGYVEKQIQKQTKKPPRMADPVGSSNNRTSQARTGNNKKFTVSNLNEEQRRFAKRFVESGAFKSEQDYVDSLAATGELG